MEEAAEEFRDKKSRKPGRPGGVGKALGGDSPKGEAAVRKEYERTKAHVETAEQYPVFQRPEWKEYHSLQGYGGGGARRRLRKLPTKSRTC